MADRFSYSSAPQRKVKALQFGVLDAEFLVRPAPGCGPVVMIVSCWLLLLRHRAVHAQPAPHVWLLRPLLQCSRCRRQRCALLAALRCCPPAAAAPCNLQRRYSVAKIETSQTYEKGRPKLGGLSDPRMGTMDRALKVGTWLEFDSC